MIRRAAVTLIVCLCALSLSLHFAVESLGGVLDHFVGEHSAAMFDSHEEDQFVSSEVGDGNPAQSWLLLPFTLTLKTVSRPLYPLFQPPKSI